MVPAFPGPGSWDEGAVKDLTGRVAVVTGGGSGVGRGIVEVLAREGASVAIADVRLSRAREVAKMLTRAGFDVFAIKADVVDRRSVDVVISEVLKQYGRVDILCANAGIYPPAPLEVMRDADWDRVMDVNVKGAVHSIQACLPAMRAEKYGRIVLTSSITGPIVGAPRLSHYAASKAALLGLMRSAALEFIHDGITVNAVQPGNVMTNGIESFGKAFITEMIKSIPVGRLAEPTDIGWAVRFLASEEAGYITGQTLVIDGGQVLPEGGIEVEV
jgi:3-oxoacyl-[acyl-carrier protein] reductase